MLAGNKGGEEELMQERERRWGLYKGMEMIIIMLPFLSKPKETHQRNLRLQAITSTSRQNELDAEIKAASRSINARSAFDE